MTRTPATLAAGLAVLLTSSALGPLFEDRGWLVPVTGGVVAVVLAGLAGRRVRVPGLLQPLVGLLALLICTTLLFAGATLAAVVPTGETGERFRALVETASDDIAQLVAPVPTTDGLVLLAVLAVGAVAVVVDVLAVQARRAALAGLPLLVLLVAPAAIADDSVGWTSFALAAAGWLLLLAVEGDERVRRWGVALGGRDGTGLGPASARIGLVALVLAVLAPVLLPVVGPGLAGEDGLGDGPLTITTYNPITTLRGDLTQPEARDILTYTTDDPRPDYLRMTTLEVYDGDGWRQGTLNGRLDRDGVDRPIPRPVGVPGTVDAQEVTAVIDVLSLKANWLPLPPTPNQVDVDGPWLWDPQSQSVFATRTDTTETDPYEVRSERVRPEAAALARAPGRVPADIEPYAERPEVTERVAQITDEVVRGAGSDFEVAVALQEHFRSSGGFTYDERTATGSSPDALEDFLTLKQGYCEQYASAMAAMLRLAGVPARVAVGFTPGTARPDGSMVVTTDNAHAWPEAWFAGAGWVRFEPTPGQGFSPDYSSSADPGESSPSTAPTPTTGPSASAPAPTAESPDERQERLDREAAALAAGGGGSQGSDGGFPLAPVLLVLAVLLLAALPAGTHLLRGRARWQRAGAAGAGPAGAGVAGAGVAGAGVAAGSGATVAAWEQVRDDARDAGHPLDPSRSPRQVLAGLAHDARLQGAPAQAVTRLSAAVEQDRYAPPGRARTEGLREDAAQVRAGLRAGLTRQERFRTALLPPSTLHWTAARARSASFRLTRAAERASTAVGDRVVVLSGRLRPRKG